VTTAHTHRIVVVDDSIDVRELLQHRIDLEPGLEWVADAADGADGVDVVLRHQPDGVVLDVEMPVMNGLVALKALRASGFDGAIVVYTSDPGAHAEARDTGADATFSKSDPLGEVVGRLLALCEQRLGRGR
jgi:chemotaxis response regulator CheB